MRGSSMWGSLREGEAPSVKTLAEGMNISTLLLFPLGGEGLRFLLKRTKKNHAHAIEKLYFCSVKTKKYGQMLNVLQNNCIFAFGYIT